MKQCIVCGHHKPVTSFFKNGYRRKDGTSGTRNECKACNKKAHDKYVDENRLELNEYMRARYTREEKKRIREYGLKRMYGITNDDYQKMLNKQKGKCAVCEISQKECKRPFDVDHNHSTGKVRGLCCMRCNRAMGLFKDDPIVLRAAAKYLIKSKK